MFDSASLTRIFNSSYYFFNPHAIPLFLACVLIALLALRVFAAGSSPAHRYFGLQCLSILGWLFFTSIEYCVKADVQIACFWSKLVWLFVPMLSVFTYALAAHFTGVRSPILIAVGLFLGAGFGFSLCYFDFLIATPYHYWWGFYNRLYPFHSLFFFTFFFSYTILAFRLYIAAYRASSDPVRRNQIKYLILAFSIAYLGSIDFAPTLGFAVYPAGVFCITLFVAINAYAMVAHHLLDIRIVIKKTLAYSIIAAMITVADLFIVSLFAALSRSWFGGALPAALLTSFLVALTFRPLLRWIQRRVDDWLDVPDPERERRVKELTEQLGSHMAHEVKTPLTNITLPAELTYMELRDATDKGLSVESLIPKILKRMQYIMQQSMIASRRVEAMRETIAPENAPKEAFLIPTMLDQTLSALNAVLAEHQIKVLQSYPTNLPKVMGNTKQIEIVFANLIKNAAEAMSANPADKPRELKLQSGQQNEHVTIRITDTGPGIPADIQARLFNENISTKGQAGAGLGLRLSRQIIQTFGGDLTVESTGSRGTTFLLSFPAHLR